MSFSVQASSGAVHVPSSFGAVPPPLLAPSPPLHEHGRIEVPLDLVSFRQLYSPQQVRQIQHLREELHLPAAVREAPAFVDLEKKETKKASWAHSSAPGRSSAPSACCR